MGCGVSKEEKAGNERNAEIETQIRRDRLMQKNEVKMLLLGPYTTTFSASHVRTRDSGVAVPRRRGHGP